MTPTFERDGTIRIEMMWKGKPLIRQYQFDRDMIEDLLRYWRLNEDPMCADYRVLSGRIERRELRKRLTRAMGDIFADSIAMMFEHIEDEKGQQ